MFQPAPRRNHHNNHHRRGTTGGGTMVSYAEVKSYLSKREIPQLFESLMAGLMYHRPENHIGYLQSCLDEVRSNSESKVQWSTFVNKSKRKSKEILPPLTPTKRQDSFNNNNSSSWSDNSRQSTPLPPISARTRNSQDQMRNTYLLYHNPPPILAKPRVPVVSVLGGLGARIDDLCERVVGRLRGVVHISTCSMLKTRMTIEGFYRMTSVPACAVVDSVLQAMSMVQSASALLVAGFPRNRGDIEEYRSRRVRMDGVVLVDFEEEALRRYLEREVSSGIVRNAEIEAELERFKQDIISVAEYYDEKELLTVVMGDQDMEEIIDDLVMAVDKIIETRKSVVDEETTDTKKEEDQETPYNGLIVSPEKLERPSTVEIRDATEEDIKLIEEEANKKVNQESKDDELSNGQTMGTENESETPEDNQTKVESSSEITDKPETTEQIKYDPSDVIVTSNGGTVQDVNEKDEELIKSKGEVQDDNTNEVNIDKKQEISENIAIENGETDKTESEKETAKDGDETKTKMVDALENEKEEKENDGRIEENEKGGEKEEIDNIGENVTEETKEESQENKDDANGQISKEEKCEGDGRENEDRSENEKDINDIPQDSEGNAQNSKLDLKNEDLNTENTSDKENENADKEDKASRKETDKDDNGDASEKNAGEQLKTVPNIPLVFAFENIEVDYDEIRNLIANDLEMCFIDFQELVRNDGSNEDKFDNEEALKMLRKILQQDSVSYSNGFFVHKFPLALINESIIEELMKLGNLSFVCNVKENEPNTESEDITVDKLFGFSFNNKLRIIFVTEGNVIEDLRAALTDIMENKTNVERCNENASEKIIKYSNLDEQNEDVELKMEENENEKELETGEKQTADPNEQNVLEGEVKDNVNENEEKDEREDVITEEKVNQDDTEDSTGRDVDDLVSDDTLNEGSKLPESSKGEENKAVANETEDTHSQASTINSADDETQKERAVLARQSGIEVETEQVSENDENIDKPKLVRQSTYSADEEAKEDESKGKEVNEEESKEKEANEEESKAKEVNEEETNGKQVNEEETKEDDTKEEGAIEEETKEEEEAKEVKEELKEEEAKEVKEELKEEETKGEENLDDNVPENVPVNEESTNEGETKEMTSLKADNAQGEGDDAETVQNENENDSNQNEGTDNGESKSNLIGVESLEAKNDETIPETKNEENEEKSEDIENKQTDNVENSQNSDDVTPEVKSEAENSQKSDDITPEIKAETEITAERESPINITNEASEKENQNSKQENNESDTEDRESAEIKILEKDNEDDKQSKEEKIEDKVENMNANGINPVEDSEINISNEDKNVEQNTEEPDQTEEKSEQKETNPENDNTEVDQADTADSKEEIDSKEEESKSNQELHAAEILKEAKEEKNREESDAVKEGEKSDSEVEKAISPEVRISMNNKVYNDSDSNDENITIETRAEVHAIDSTSPLTANAEVPSGENAEVENNESNKTKPEEIPESENDTLSNKNKINESEINTSLKETILDNDPEALQESIGGDRFSGKRQERNGSGILDESLDRHQGDEEEPQERSSSSSRGEL